MNSVKVYKTNLDNRETAKSILEEIRKTQPGSDPSFDLEDCDNVLRVENSITDVNESGLNEILKNHGYNMEVLL